MKLKSFRFISILLFSFWLFNFTGCATVPQKEALPTYNINGAGYYSLVSLCEAKVITWQYDTFSRSVNLERDAHKVNLRVGDNLVLVDGNALIMDHPVDIYQGVIVVPTKFKEQVIDALFKGQAPVQKKICVQSRIKKIVIDAGHGGNDPGAIGRTGLNEKDVNLDIAKRLANLLKSEGFLVTLTRSSDVFIPLQRRPEIANNGDADLFVSIHSNANRVRSLNGFEAYYVAPTVSDSNRACAAAKDSAPSVANGSLASGSQDLKAILWDMTYTDARAESIELSQSICKSMDNNLDAKVLGIKSARFEVLKGARMPAVLIEVGFVSNTNEERMLKNGFYREKIAESIAEGINRYAQDITIMEASKK